MNQKMLAIVGNFGMRKKCGKGFSVFSYDAGTAEMELLGEHFLEVNVGCQSYDSVNSMLYFTDEFWSRRGQTGGGGYMMAAAVNRDTGALSLVSDTPSLAANPSHFCVDKTRRFGIVVHHCTDNYVTKVVRGADGGYGNQVLFDDCLAVLFRLNTDGSLGEVCDIKRHQARVQNGAAQLPHLHSVVPDATGNYYIVSDKGLDKLYVYAIDYDAETLRLVSEADAEPGTEPRYGVFHPSLPIYYGNCEQTPVVYAYGFEPETGTLTPKLSQPLLEETDRRHWEGAMPSDIVIHPNGKTLYVTVRGLNLISVLDIAEDGALAPRQNISCGGHNPRGLCLAPDGRHLLVANVDNSDVSGLRVAPGGSLSPMGRLAMTNCPGSISIIEL